MRCITGRLATVLIAFGSASVGAQVNDLHTHDQIVAYFRAVPAGVMPPGDTLVTWRSDGPILYHTASRSGASVRAGMFRNDALIGAATVDWTAASPIAFSVRWLGNAPLTLRGRVEGKEIVLSGSRNERETIPAGLWAVADYGMDDLLLPLVSTLREKPQPISSFAHSPTSGTPSRRRSRRATMLPCS